MGATMVDKLRRQADEARRQADRLDKMVQLATELGDDGLSELVTLLTPPAESPAQEETNGHAAANGHSNGNGHHLALRQGRDGRTYGNRYTRETPGMPRGREAVRLVVSERPGIWTLAEIREALYERGWFTSRKAVEAAAKRLCIKDGEGRRIGPGRYVFPPNYGELPQPDETEGAIESHASGAAMIAYRE